MSNDPTEWNPTRFRPRRTRGYRKPENSTVCGRSSIAGNPFRFGPKSRAFGPRVAFVSWCMAITQPDAVIDPHLLNAIARSNNVVVDDLARHCINGAKLADRLRSGYYKQFDAIGCPGCEPDDPNCHLVALTRAVNLHHKERQRSTPGQ